MPGEGPGSDGLDGANSVDGGTAGAGPGVVDDLLGGTSAVFGGVDEGEVVVEVDRVAAWEGGFLDGGFAEVCLCEDSMGEGDG